MLTKGAEEEMAEVADADDGAEEVVFTGVEGA
jgi:hypothetical protein